MGKPAVANPREKHPPQPQQGHRGRQAQDAQDPDAALKALEDELIEQVL